MKSKTLLFSALIGLLLCACQAAENSASGAPKSTAARPRALDFSTLAQGSHSGLAAPLACAIRTSSGWSELWARHARDSAASLPAVDFATQMVLVVALGESPGGNASVAIERVQSDAGFLRVEARARGLFESADAARSQPYTMVRVALSDAPVEFKIAR